jgi:hypothetical protein
MPAGPAARPQRPFLIMNPRSGGGKVIKFALKEKAETLGAQVALLEAPQIVDVTAVARQAVADGADRHQPDAAPVPAQPGREPSPQAG